MEQDRIRRAAPADAPRLDAALSALSDYLGEPHRSGPEDLAEALGAGIAHAVIAETGPDAPLAGCAFFSRAFSTYAGGAGLFVSDLWIADARRGTGLGRRLLVATAEAGREMGCGTFVRLAVHDINDGARAFYERLGFRRHPGEGLMTLGGARLAALGGAA